MELRRCKKAFILGLFCITATGRCNPQLPHLQQAHQPVLETPFSSTLIIPVAIKGKTYHFIVDTGASLTVIDNKLAKEITRPLAADEIPQHHREAFTDVTTVTGLLDKKHYSLFKPVPFFIGSEEIGDNEIWIAADTTLFTQSLGVNIDGFIGIDTFRQLNWQVDNQAKRLIVTKEAPTTRSWQRCTGYEDSYNRSPQLWFSLGTDDIAFRIDTGADRTYVGQKFIDYATSQQGTLMPDNKRSRNGDMGGAYHTPLYILKGLTFNNLPLGELKVTGNNNELYAVGMDFLSRFSRYAFMPSRMMFCYDVSTLERSGLASQRSLSVRYNGQFIELYYNSDDDLKGTGLLNGDSVIRINGTAYPPAQINEVRNLLEMTPPGKLTLSILRGDKRHEIHL